jgi:hypothetical protein
MTLRALPLLGLLLAASLLTTPALAQSDEVQQLQKALDDLEVVEALIQGKVTSATRTQALQQLEDARLQVEAVQAAMMKAHGPHAAPPPHAGATVTVTEGSNGAGATVQVGGPGASLSINLNVEGEAAPPPPIVVEPPPPPPPVKPAPMNMPPAAFATLRGAIQTESFSDGKLTVLRTALADHRLSVQQASQLLPLFDFSSDRVEAAVAIYPRLVDPENFFQLYSAFDFESDKEEVRKKLGL